MAKWFVEVKPEFATKEDLADIFSALACKPKNKQSTLVNGNWVFPVKGPDSMDAVTPLPNGVVNIYPRP